MPRSLTPHPAYAERVREAREHTCLSSAQIAENLGKRSDFFGDLENDDTELLMCISLGDIASLCSVLGIQPAALLADRPDLPTVRVPYPELVERIRTYIQLQALDVTEFEDQAGWTVGPALEDPALVSQWNVDGLYDICELIGVDWLAALPSATAVGV